MLLSNLLGIQRLSSAAWSRRHQSDLLDRLIMVSGSGKVVCIRGACHICLNARGTPGDNCRGGGFSELGAGHANPKICVWIPSLWAALEQHVL